LAASEPEEARRLTATIHGELAFAHLELEEYVLAERHVLEAERLWRQLGEPVEVGRALRYQANLRVRLGDLEAGEALCHAALGVLGKAERQEPTSRADDQQPTPASAGAGLHPGQHPVVRGPIHNLRGAIHAERGRHDEARRELVRALCAARELGEARAYWSLAPMLQLGHVHQRRGRRPPDGSRVR
jgi:tetratricopeptide (TPR) repeat protein